MHETASALLNNNHGRYTRARRALIELILSAGKPVTVEELRALAPQHPQSSLYRNLATLEQTGVVRRLTGHNGVARYELAEHLTGHHHHLVCDTCGTITDTELPSAVERTLDDAIAHLATKHNFQVASHSIDILGRCETCTTGQS